MKVTISAISRTRDAENIKSAHKLENTFFLFLNTIFSEQIEKKETRNKDGAI